MDREEEAAVCKRNPQHSCGKQNKKTTHAELIAPYKPALKSTAVIRRMQFENTAHV